MEKNYGKQVKKMDDLEREDRSGSSGSKERVYRVRFSVHTAFALETVYIPRASADR